jgi:hypothetical protein
MTTNETRPTVTPNQMTRNETRQRQDNFPVSALIETCLTLPEKSVCGTKEKAHKACVHTQCGVSYGPARVSLRLAPRERRLEPGVRGFNRAGLKLNEYSLWRLRKLHK